MRLADDHVLKAGGVLNEGAEAAIVLVQHDEGFGLVDFAVEVAVVVQRIEDAATGGF